LIELCPACGENPARLIEHDGEELVAICEDCGAARRRRSRARILGKRLHQMLEKRGVPKKFFGSELTDFQSRYQKLIGADVYLTGNRGTGKTHLMTALLKADINDGDSDSLFITAPELLLQIREAFSKNSDTTEAQAISPFLKVKNLFLDDLGTEKMSEWAAQAFFVLVDSRYREGKRTVISSNLDLDELACHIGDRIPSRLSEMCRVIEMKGKDRRL
jgi:DNA replication protein DnaC